jgi:hypothetical protein
VSYTLEFPELTIGGITYYHDSPNDPVDIEGVWLPYPQLAAAVTFFPGKRVKDENNKETFDIEGEFIVHLTSKGVYTLSSRNLPGQSFMVTIPSYIHGTMLFYFINIMLNINLLELFDLSVLVPPETQADVENWWFTIPEIRRYFEAAASRATDLDTQSQVLAAMRYFFNENGSMSYDYTVEYDEEVGTTYESAENIPGQNNKLTLRVTRGGGTYTYYKFDGETGTW